MTRNATFINRRRIRSWTASEGSYIRVAPLMPPGAVFSGRFEVAMNFFRYGKMRRRREQPSFH
jgi:uncharacterized protein (UPF0305 family)